MIILNCSNISLSFGVEPILNNVSFSLQEKEKAALVGVNGAGKSTLFKIISGELKSDSGEVYTAKGCRIGYLKQNSGLDTAGTVWDEMICAFTPLIEMEERLKQLESRISSEKNESKLSSLMKEYANLSDRFASSGGYEYIGRTRGVLRGLGFEDSMFSLSASALSGGQKTRLALARLLLEEPDILLLDEPTNHLDIHALEWLEDFLKGYGKSILLISHDRYFLDAVTTSTIELENCSCKVYPCNYTQYMQRKTVDREIQQSHYEQQQKEIARLEAIIEQQRRWNRERNIIAAESRQKALDRMEKIDKPKKLPDKISVRFRTSATSGSDVLYAEDLGKEYPGKRLFSSVSFQVKKGERVFILGPNGCGKSTLLKILEGRLDGYCGSVAYGHNVIAGYYDQEHEDLHEASSVLEEVWSSNEKLTQTEVRNALASFLFKGEDVQKPVSVLSGGEKSRIALVKLILSGANLLFLDEPTNHLDINSREALEAALQDFDGTILAVSHDRYFINKLATRILDIGYSPLIDYRGNYSDFLTYRQKQAQKMSVGTEVKKISASKLDYIGSKEQKARQRKLEKQLNEAEQEINHTEARLKELEAEMQKSCSDHVRLVELQEEKSKHEARLEELYMLWESTLEEKQKMEQLTET